MILSQIEEERKNNMAREYIHEPSIGNSKECDRIHTYLVPIVHRLYTSGKSSGHQVLKIVDQETIDREYILSDIKSITRGRFPFIFVAIESVEDYSSIDGICECTPVKKQAP